MQAHGLNPGGECDSPLQSPSEPLSTRVNCRQHQRTLWSAESAHTPLWRVRVTTNTLSRLRIMDHMYKLDINHLNRYILLLV